MRDGADNGAGKLMEGWNRFYSKQHAYRKRSDSDISFHNSLRSTPGQHVLGCDPELLAFRLNGMWRVGSWMVWVRGCSD
jgi:hypothetical protein